MEGSPHATDSDTLPKLPRPNSKSDAANLVDKDGVCQAYCCRLLVFCLLLLFFVFVFHSLIRVLLRCVSCCYRVYPSNLLFCCVGFVVFVVVFLSLSLFLVCVFLAECLHAYVCCTCLSVPLSLSIDLYMCGSTPTELANRQRVPSSAAEEASHGSRWLHAGTRKANAFGENWQASGVQEWQDQNDYWRGRI
jgi:hypothetical protein